MQNIINIGIVAHVDAGKTSITENILYKADAIRTKGSVDSGSTVTDSLDIERKRGISVKAASTSFKWNNITINLIDTPGHADFTAEVERCLTVLDAAILVISAVEGVQSHTYALWDALQNMNIPTIIVVNKIDRQGADFINVLEELKSELKINTFAIQSPENEGQNNADIISLWKNSDLMCDASGIKNLAIENLAETNEEVLEMYLDGNLPDNNTMLKMMKDSFVNGTINPVFITVAKNDIGTTELLNGITNFINPKQYNTDNDFAAFVYKVEHSPKLGRLAHIKVFSGSVKPRETIFNSTLKTENKVAQIKKTFTQKYEDITILKAGDVGILSGLTDVVAGNILGNSNLIPKQTVIQQPVLSVQVKPLSDEHFNALADALQLLNIEDPALNFIRYNDEKELHITLMGSVQMEILESIIDERFNIKCEFSEPTVIYKETPVKQAEGFAEYTMPKPCWAVIKFKIEPGEPCSGIIYKSEVSVDKIARKYQNEIEETIPKALQQGIKGWEVTDIKITLTDGENHEIHSRPGDFILATPMAIMDGLKNSNTQLLEPVFNFEIKAPEEMLGSIASDLTNMRADFANPEFNNEKFILKGSVPVATSMDYSIKLNSATSGKGKIKLSFGGYRKCSDEQGVIRPYKGVNPLDRSQWILHNRGAFKADERKY